MYDKDGSGEIDPEEMEDIFKKLCKIAAGIEADHYKIEAEEKERERKVERRKEEKEEREMERKLVEQETMNKLGLKKPQLFSKKISRIVSSNSALGIFGKKADDGRRKSLDGSKTRRKSLESSGTSVSRKTTAINSESKRSEQMTEEEKERKKEEEEKKKVMSTIMQELKDPSRDCNKFDPGKIN